MEALICVKPALRCVFIYVYIWIVLWSDSEEVKAPPDFTAGTFVKLFYGRQDTAGDTQLNDDHRQSKEQHEG